MSKDTLIGVGVPFITTCRVTGYLSNYARINNAKQQEIRQRTVNTSREENVTPRAIAAA